MSLYHSLKKKNSLPSLQELCIRVLIDNKQSLGDVGDIPSRALKSVLCHCTPDELQRIEDTTMERSGRDIRWDSWQIWKRHYVSKYGKPNPDEVPELKAFPNSPIDPDNPPEDLGDYRSLYEQKVRKTDEQRRKLGEKIRSLKKSEAKSREKTKAKRIGMLYPSKKALSKPKLGKSEKHYSSGLSAAEFYQKIGLGNKSRSIFKRR